jgi:hypothetical protein
MCDVRVVQRGEDFGLALESGDPLRIVGDLRRQDLERDLAFQDGVGRAIDLL